MDKYYFTAVHDHGVPLYLRNLTYEEADVLFKSYGDRTDIVFCQYGSVDGIINTHTNQEYA